jgi:uncharacterized protein YukE
MMSRDSDPGVYNPYGQQTYENTTEPWLSDTTPVDVDLDGLQEYAKHMSDARTNLMSQQAHLSHLMSTPMQAWNGNTLGEAAYTRSQMLANASEFTSYLAVLGATLMNIGSAAQTVADIYNSADGTSAASLSDVLFAFGDPTVDRPSSLPKGIGKTYDDAVREQQAKATEAPPADDSQWHPPVQTVNSPYETVLVSYSSTGQRREVTTTSSPYGGPVVVTSVTYDAKGKAISTTSTRTSYSYDYANGVSTKTVESYTGDKLTGKAVTDTTYNGTTGEAAKTATTNTDGAGKSTGGRVETVDPKTGEQVTVTTSTDKDGKPVETDRVAVGKATPGQLSVEAPLADQYDPSLNQTG